MPFIPSFSRTNHFRDCVALSFFLDATVSDQVRQLQDSMVNEADDQYHKIVIDIIISEFQFELVFYTFSLRFFRRVFPN